MNDDPFGPYLQARARTIDVPATDVADIASRAEHRRHRRHVTALRTAAAVAVVGVAAGVVSLATDDETPVSSTPTASQTSPLEWHVVDPVAGLGAARSLVATDGAVFGLSTAPGPADPTDAAVWRSDTLYRSTDGAEWEALALPDDLYASALAADGGNLYAVGTGPTGGGGVPLRVSASADAGGTWSSVDIPSGVADLEARYPGEIVLGAPTIASFGGTTMVAATVSASIDVEDRLPDGVDTENGWTTTTDGVDVYGPMTDGCAEATTAVAAPTVVAADGSAREPCSAPIASHHTWAELGVPTELVDLLSPDVLLFTSSDGQTFEPVAPPVTDSSGLRLLGSAAGFTVLAQDGAGWMDPTVPAAVEVFRSTDGRTWTPVATVPGFLEGAGPLRDGIGFATRADQGGLTVHLLGDDGTSLIVDPLAAVPEDQRSNESYFGQVAFGPLGWATTLTASDRSGLVVHTDPTGAVLSSVAIPEDLTGVESGVVVSADAVTVRYTEDGDGDPATVPAQHLFVGTPTGG